MSILPPLPSQTRIAAPDCWCTSSCARSHCKPLPAFCAALADASADGPSRCRNARKRKIMVTHSAHKLMPVHTDTVSAQHQNSSESETFVIKSSGRLPLKVTEYPVKQWSLWTDCVTGLRCNMVQNAPSHLARCRLACNTASADSCSWLGPFWAFIMPLLLPCTATSSKSHFEFHGPSLVIL